MKITPRDPLGLTSLTKEERTAIIANCEAVMATLNRAGLNHGLLLIVLITALIQALTDIADPAVRLYGGKIVTDHLAGAVKASTEMERGGGLH